MLNSSGIRLHIWFYFIFFALTLTILMWVLEYAFVSMYFNEIKLQSITKMGREIIFSNNAIFNVDIDNRAKDNNVTIIIFDASDGSIIYGSGISTSDFDINLIANAVAQINYNKQPYEYTNEAVRGRIFFPTEESNNLVYCAKNDNFGIYITSPLFRISGTTSILASQLLVVTLVSLFLGFVLSGFLSLRLARPIVMMSGQARKLATGDYNVEFNGNSFTELNELCDTLNFATKQLAATDKIRRDLIANVSHDLKTPLTLIISYAELIRDLSGDNKDKRDKDLNVIIDEANRLTDLVNDMLKVSKIEDPSTSLDLAKINLSELVLKVYNHFEVKISQGYTVDLNIQPDLFVIADTNKIEQVIYNLFSNAVNYAGKDKWVGINLSRNNGNVRFEISDHGAGINAEDIDSIWDRYYRSSDKRKRGSGTGLGLNIVKTILTRHNAGYGVNSTLGKGSCFFFEMKEG